MTNKLIASVTFLFMLTTSHGQNYWFGFITTKGDTINRKDSLGYYQGLHVELDVWPCKQMNDSCNYRIGYYKNGQPIGDWTDHKKDGSFSIGHYNSGVQVTSDGKGGWTEKHQGIYAKIGVWNYYDRDSNLLKTERYDRTFTNKGWTDVTFTKTSNDSFIMTSYEFMNKRDYYSRFKQKRQITFYQDNGKTKSYYSKNFFQNIYKEYNTNGIITQKVKIKTFFGNPTKTTITTDYFRGKRRKVTKQKILLSPHSLTTPTF